MAGSAAPFTATPRLLLVGDSVADTLSNALAATARGRGLSFSAAVRPGCGLVTGVPAYPTGGVIPWGPACADGTLGYLSSAVQASTPDVVLWLSTWETADRIVNGRFYAFGTPDADAMLLQKFEETRQVLTATGARLLLVTIPPRAKSSASVPTDNPAEDAQYLHLDDLFRQFAAQHEDSVGAVDLARIVCPAGPPCPTVIDGVQLRPDDGGHYAGGGPAWVAPRLLDAMMRELHEAPRTEVR